MPLKSAFLDFAPLSLVKSAPLSGVVDHLAAKKTAEDSAKDIVGGWRVINHLRVRPKSLPHASGGIIEVANNLTVPSTLPSKLDWQLRLDIDQRLWWSPFVDSEAIDVPAEDNVATLTGTVDNYPK